jgi:hypothetical protein
MMLLKLLFFIIFKVVSSGTMESEAPGLLVEFQVKLEGVRNDVVTFQLHSGDPVAESVVSFCTNYNVPKDHCDMLMGMVWSRIEEENLLGGDSQLLISNEHPRIHEAFFNQMNPSKAAKEDHLEFYDIALSQSHKELAGWKRVAVLHSCGLQQQTYDVLSDMLRRIDKAGGLSALDSIWVLHYGVPLRSQVKEQFPSVHFVETGASCATFEIPTLLSLQKLAGDVRTARLAAGFVGAAVDSHFLYMHTKGVSYQKIPLSVHDWRNMMMYFLVEQHTSCFHLLESGRFDVLGANYQADPKGRVLFGNFWWASGSYLASLPPVVRASNADKNAAETYILGSDRVRVFELHHATVEHNQQYPRALYDESSPPPDCVNVNYCLRSFTSS